MEPSWETRQGAGGCMLENVLDKSSISPRCLISENRFLLHIAWGGAFALPACLDLERSCWDLGCFLQC